jgi:hypothetical protein
MRIKVTHKLMKVQQSSLEITGIKKIDLNYYHYVCSRVIVFSGKTASWGDVDLLGLGVSRNQVAFFN